MNDLEREGTKRGYRFYRKADGRANTAVKGAGFEILLGVSIRETPSGRWSVRVSEGRFSGYTTGTYKSLTKAFDVADKSLEEKMS